MSDDRDKPAFEPLTAELMEKSWDNARKLLQDLGEDPDKMISAADNIENIYNIQKDALAFLLVRIGSWTHARWDQHLRNEFGDEKANIAIEWIESLCQPGKFANRK